MNAFSEWKINRRGKNDSVFVVCLLFVCGACMRYHFQIAFDTYVNSVWRNDFNWKEEQTEIGLTNHETISSNEYLNRELKALVT